MNGDHKGSGDVPPDLVLLDIGLPKVNGYDVARRISQQAWGQQVIPVALTGWGHDEDRLRSTEAGFNFHVVKPVELSGLETLLAGSPAKQSELTLALPMTHLTFESRAVPAHL